jgi:hypothetical protein
VPHLSTGIRIFVPKPPCFPVCNSCLLLIKRIIRNGAPYRALVLHELQIHKRLHRTICSVWQDKRPSGAQYHHISRRHRNASKAEIRAQTSCRHIQSQWRRIANLQGRRAFILALKKHARTQRCNQSALGNAQHIAILPVRACNQIVTRNIMRVHCRARWQYIRVQPRPLHHIRQQACR